MSDSKEDYWGFGRTCGCAFGISFALAMLICGGLSELFESIGSRAFRGETPVFCCGTVLYVPIYCLVSYRFVIRLSGVLASVLWGFFWGIGMLAGGVLSDVVFLEQNPPEGDCMLELVPVFLGIALAHGVVAMFVYRYRTSGLRKGRGGLICMNCGNDLRGLTEPRCPECNTPIDAKLLRKNA